MKNLLLSICVLLTSISFAQKEIEVYICQQNLKDGNSARLEIEILNENSVTIVYSTFRCPGCDEGDFTKSGKREYFLSYGVYRKSSKSILSKSSAKKMQNTYYIKGGYIVDHDDVYNESMTFYVVEHYFKHLSPTMDIEESQYYD